MKLFLVLLLSYFLGAIPSGYLFTRFIKGMDLREFGSGNVGATNVARVMGLKYGIIVASLDIFKGYLAVGLSQFLLPADTSRLLFLVIGVLAIIGHDWSVFLKFSGGKGVATTVGVVLRLMPLSFIFFAIPWLTLVILTRYVSLASIIASLSIPVLIYFINLDYYFFIFTLVLALLIIFTHRSNIKRLLKGEENKMSLSSGMGKSGKNG